VSGPDHPLDLQRGVDDLPAKLSGGASAGPEPEGDSLQSPIHETPGPITNEFVLSLLVWEAGHSKAAGAAKRIAASIVDCNELRICLEDDITGLLGVRYPRCRERAARLRSALNAIYEREHAVSLEHLATMPKRDARAYLASLDGTPPFVASRVSLLSLGAHAFPLDGRLQALLTKANALAPELSLEAAAAWLERQFRAGEVETTYLMLEEWSDVKGRVRRSKRSSPRPVEHGAGDASGDQPGCDA